MCKLAVWRYLTVSVPNVPVPPAPTVYLVLGSFCCPLPNGQFGDESLGRAESGPACKMPLLKVFSIWRCVCDLVLSRNFEPRSVS